MELNTQGTAVTWDDPRERQARHNLMHEEAGRQDAENVSPNVPPLPSAGAAKRRSAPVLVFSGLEPAERGRCAALAERLGGTVLDSATLEASVTHLVTARPNRSEKHLAAVASGRWLLQPAYLDACERAGHFLKVRPMSHITLGVGREGAHIGGARCAQSLLVESAGGGRVRMGNREPTP